MGINKDLSVPAAADTFTGSFILSGKPEPEPELILSAISESLAGCRVMVVEDHPINQQVVQSMLELEGVIVSIAANGWEAVLAVTETEWLYDAVLMDLQMPEMDGYEATRLIRKLWSADRLPIIAMSAHAPLEERELCLNSGMNDFLAKPLFCDQLYACLKQWIRPRLTQETPFSMERRTAPRDVLPYTLPGLDVFTGLTLLGGNLELYRKLVITYGSCLGERIDSLKEVLAEGDLTRSRNAAHALKGVAGNLGATELHKVAGDLEAACLNGAAGLVCQLFPVLAARAAEVISAATLLADQVPKPDTITGDFDPEAALALAYQIAELALQHDLTAQECSDQLFNMLARSNLATQAGALVKTLARVDFRTGVRQLAELIVLLEQQVNAAEN